MKKIISYTTIGTLLALVLSPTVKLVDSNDFNLDVYSKSEADTYALNGSIDPDLDQESNIAYNQLLHWEDFDDANTFNIAPEFSFLFDGAHQAKGQSWALYETEEAPNGFAYDESTDTYSVSLINFRKIYAGDSTDESLTYYTDLNEDHASINDYYVVEPYKGRGTVSTGPSQEYSHEIVERQRINHEFTGVIYNKENPAFEYTDKDGNEWVAGGYVDTITGLEFGKDYYLATDWNNIAGEPGVDDENYSMTYSEIFTTDGTTDQSFTFDGDGHTWDSNLQSTAVHQPQFMPIKKYKNNEVIGGSEGITLDIFNEDTGKSTIDFNIHYENNNVDIEESFADDQWTTYNELNSFSYKSFLEINLVNKFNGNTYTVGKPTVYSDESVVFTNDETNNLTNVHIEFSNDEIEYGYEYELQIKFINQDWDPNVYGSLNDNSLSMDISVGEVDDTIIAYQPDIDWVTEDEGQFSILFEKDPNQPDVELNDVKLYGDATIFGDGTNPELLATATPEQLDFNGKDVNRVTFNLTGLNDPSLDTDGNGTSEYEKGDLWIEYSDSNEHYGSSEIESFETLIEGEAVMKSATLKGINEENQVQFEVVVSSPLPNNNIQFRAYNEYGERVTLTTTVEEVIDDTTKSTDREDHKYLITVESVGEFTDIQASINGGEYKDINLRDEDGREVRTIDVVPPNDVPNWLSSAIAFVIALVIITIFIGIITFFIVRYLSAKSRE